MILLIGCLASKKVTDIEVVSPDVGDTLALCPGIVQPLEVELRLKNGRTKHTRSSGRDGVAWREIELVLDGQTSDGTGVTLYQDPRKSQGKELDLIVRLADRPELARRYSVVPRYDCDYVADLRGGSGWTPSGAWDDLDGSDGAPASTDDDGRAQGAGQDGTAGGSGRNGEHGNDGGAGGHARVFVYAHEDLVQVKVEGEVLVDGEWRSKTRRYLLDPEGGTLRIDVRGGGGGHGEDGQDGGNGGLGGEGDPMGRHGSGGHGGHGGDGGDGGPGGDAVLFVDPGVTSYLDKLVVDHGGGPGGEGGRSGQGGAGDVPGQTGAGGRRGRDGEPGPLPVTHEDHLKKLF
ncbi:MAG TPA: hypothetical protein QGF58_09555 [Myxococcota bacterium]|nr:hypothetical protein [Myxococcota bacterium]